jgi:hypothetical protein
MLIKHRLRNDSEHVNKSISHFPSILHPTPQHAAPPQTPRSSSPVVSLSLTNTASSIARLFGGAVGRLETVGKLLAVLVGGVVGQQLLARGALEGLEAGFALDGLRRGILRRVVSMAHRKARGAGRTDLIWDLASLGPASPLRSRFCCALETCC